MRFPITLAVLSDLHAAPKADPPDPSIKLLTDASEHFAREHPFGALSELVKQEKLRADFVVCPGDMTDKANPAGVQYVWKRLHDLKTELQSSDVIATVGNHDVDSRGAMDDESPRETLLKLEPRFPTSNEHLSDRFWAHGYFLNELLGVRFLVLNSCWLHEAQRDLERGSITRYTIERIRKELESAPRKAGSFGIAVVHHHPLLHAEHGLGQDDIMRNGHELLSVLADTAPWLVIHGHKHHPKLTFASAQHLPPVVFAAGSFSGRLEGANAAVSRNMFHLLTITQAEEQLCGRIRSWAFTPGAGWDRFVPPRIADFASEMGFGFVGRIDALARAIAASLSGKPFLDWHQVQELHADVDYLLPRQLKALEDELAGKHHIRIQRDGWGRLVQVGGGEAV